MDQLMTVREVAQLFQVPVSWIYDRTRRHGPERIPHLKVGKYLRFRRDEVETFIDRYRRWKENS